MTIRRFCPIVAASLCCLILTSSESLSLGGGICLDPAIRHTNGMPIASSEPLRTNSVSWTCNPDNLGYCGGHYYWPCCDSLRPSRLWAAAHGCYTPAQHHYRWYAGHFCPPGEAPSEWQGIESTGMSTLGQLPNAVLVPGAPGAAPLAPNALGR